MVDSVALLPSVTPLPGAAAAAVAWRTQGQLHITVVVKATFSFAPHGEMTPAPPQPVHRSEVRHGNAQGQSVRFASDLAPYLGRADVLFTGYAYAPPSGAVQTLPVRLALFDGHRFILDKRLVVKARDGFQRMPIVYERALSGANGHENPLGIDPATGGEANLIDPAEPSRPAGFGPIARAWPSRKRLLGATPRDALEGPIADIPRDFDWSYFQSAPLDQRVHFLRGDEWVVLEGLHPSVPTLQTRLPRALGCARLYGLSPFGTAEGHELTLSADTLHIDGEEQCCTIVWRHAFQVPGEEALAAVRIVGGVLLPGGSLPWDDPGVDVALNVAQAPEQPSSGKVSSPDLLSAPRPQAAAADPEELTRHEVGGTTMLLSRERLLELREQLAGDRDEPAPETRRGAVSPQEGGAGEEEDRALDALLPTSERTERGTAAPAAMTRAAPSSRAPMPPPRASAPPPRASTPPSRGSTLPPRAPTPPPPTVADVLPTGLFDLPEPVPTHAEPSDGSPSWTSPLSLDIRLHADKREALDLLWFDRRSLPRARKHAAWRAILDDLRGEPPDPDADAPALDEEPAAAEERRDIFAVLAHGAPLAEGELFGAMEGAIRGDGRFVAPLVLLAGELTLPFDAIEALKALVASVASLAGGDDRLRSAIFAAREFLQTVDPLSPASVAEELATGIKDAYAKGKRALPFARVEAQAERALLEQRRYQRRAVFGGRRLRALLLPAGAERPVPAYLPEQLAEAIPMFYRLKARLVAEAHLAADQHEAHPVALRVVALARLGAP